MTQEELDALMSGDDTNLDSLKDEVVEETDNKKKKNTTEAEDEAPPAPPPPPTNDNKMVDQLDDVTRESEQKAVEIFDSIENISEAMMDIEAKLADDIPTIINKNIELFSKLEINFPQVTPFSEAKKDNEKLIILLEELVEAVQVNTDEITMIMDKMQYQDIHRQKIERVVNIMRSLALYMNHLFSSERDDATRTSSAKHIPGDEGTANVVSNDDIEALLANFGN
jgi:hypothetical protein